MRGNHFQSEHERYKYNVHVQSHHHHHRRRRRRDHHDLDMM